MRIPNVTSKPVQQDGSMNRDWYQYLQSLGVSISSLLANSTLTGSVVPYVTSPRNGSNTITSAVLTNSTGGAITVNVYNVPSGGSPGVGNIVISARSIAAGTSYACPELVGLVLKLGATLQASGSGLSFVVNGTVSQ